MSKGIYVHIPFCVQKCPYCDFYSGASDEPGRLAYAERLAFAIETAPWEFSADTLYIGGGTPTTLPPAALAGILAAAKRRYHLENAECTVEANPGTVTPDDLRRLFDAGFHRISFGVQSTDDDTLSRLGRIHTAAEAKETIRAAYGAGFRHISADLMLAVPGQTPETVRRDVRRLTALPIDHLSAYLLHVEEGTPFFGRVEEPGDDLAADCYEAAVSELRKAGFFQYEISNFSREKGAESRHNLHYWRCEEYLGVGAAAHSFLNGRRFYLPRSRRAFLTAENPWSLTVDDGAGGGEEERILLGLRLAEGIALSDFSSDTAQRLKTRAVPLVQNGLAVCENGRLSLTERGFLVSNAAIASLL